MCLYLYTDDTSKVQVMRTMAISPVNNSRNKINKKLMTAVQGKACLPMSILNNIMTSCQAYLMQTGQVIVCQCKLAQALQDHQERHTPDDSVPVNPFQHHLL